MSAAASFICRAVRHAGAARPYRPRHLGPAGAAGAARIGGQKDGRHRVRVQRAQRLCRGGLSLGQSPALLRAGRRAVRTALRWASPMSREFDVPPGTAEGICAFYPEFLGIATELQERRRQGRARQGRPGPVSAVPRDRPRAARIRRPPCADLHHPISPAPIESSGETRPSLCKRTTSTNIAFATSSIPQAANICSRSSMKCAAPRIRCICGPLINRPQPGRDQPHLRRRPRAMGVGYGTGPVRPTIKGRVGQQKTRSSSLRKQEPIATDVSWLNKPSTLVPISRCHGVWVLASRGRRWGRRPTSRGTRA